MRKRRRKAYTVVLLLTVLAIGGILWYAKRPGNNIPTVQTAVVSRSSVTETVVCAGTVAAGDGVEVYTSVPCVAGDVAVEVGDRVKEGDVLLTVDRSATLALAVSAGLSTAQDVSISSALPQTVTAPADGIVSAVNAEKGDLLDTSSPCMVLSAGSGVEIAVVLQESILPKMAVGQAVEISGVAFEKEVYHGIVAEIASTARSRVSGTTTQTVVDAVVIPEASEVDESLLIGLNAKVSVTVADRDDVLLVPYDCVMQAEDGESVVYRVCDGIAQLCTVTVGEEWSQGIEILEGLREGDTVVIDPDALEGEQVRVNTEGDV